MPVAQLRDAARLVRHEAVMQTNAAAADTFECGAASMEASDFDLHGLQVEQGLGPVAAAILASPVFCFSFSVGSREGHSRRLCDLGSEGLLCAIFE